MNVLEIFKLALRALAANKMRTLLTMLGIIIGVASVITMLSIGQGVSQSVQSSITSLGANILTVSPGSISSGGVFGAGMENQRLTVEDAKAISSECPAVAYTSPMVMRSMQVIYGNQNWGTTVYGISEDYDKIRDWNLSSGDFLTTQDVQSSSKVCVIGSEIVDNLFDGQDPVGEILRVQKVPFRIIGVLESKGQSGMGNMDDCVLVPYTTAMTRLNRMRYLRSIICSVVSEEQTDAAKQQITDLLRQRHRLSPDAEDDFTIRSQADLAAVVGQTMGVFTIFLSAIALISLLVGGIGIMNIMLVSVTERIREIGIRMALGARGKDILMQFLTESMVLSILGGFIGIAIGVILSFAISYFAKWETLITPFSIILSFGFSAFVGIFFGFYPAWKASQLDPIEALRHE